MKRLTQIFQALLGVVALIFTAIIAFDRLAWRTIRNWWKRSSRWVRRSIATVLILILVGFVALIAYAYYDSEYGRWYWKDNYLSKNVEVHGFRDYKVRVYNYCAGKYTTPKVNWVADSPANDSLTVYAIPYGIMSRITGKPITLALYSDINMLSKDLFEVQDPESYDWYLVDTKGNVVSKK